MKDQPRQPVRIVISGGPRAGKTTIARRVADDFGDRVAVLPEAATMLYSGGFPRSAEKRGQRAVQRAIFSVQRQLEEASHAIWPDRIHLCDRSTLDGASYWPGGISEFLEDAGITLEEEYARYSRVILVQSSAWLSDGYSTTDTLRTESPQRARELDQKLDLIYQGHPDLVRIPAEADFSIKTEMVLECLREVLDREKLQVGF